MPTPFYSPLHSSPSPPTTPTPPPVPSSFSFAMYGVACRKHLIDTGQTAISPPCCLQGESTPDSPILPDDSHTVLGERILDVYIPAYMSAHLVLLCRALPFALPCLPFRTMICGQRLAYVLCCLNRLLWIASAWESGIDTCRAHR